MSNEQEQYLQAIGARVLADQLATQQHTAPPRDTATAQNLRSQQIAANHLQAEQRRIIEAAQQRGREQQAQREREQAQTEQARAEQVEADTKEVERAAWLAAGNLAVDFEKQWRAQYMKIEQERRQGQDAAYRQQWMQRHGGF